MPLENEEISSRPTFRVAGYISQICVGSTVTAGMEPAHHAEFDFDITQGVQPRCSSRVKAQSGKGGPYHRRANLSTFRARFVRPVIGLLIVVFVEDHSAPFKVQSSAGAMLGLKRQR